MTDYLKDYKKYLPLAGILILIYVGYLLVRPYLTAMLTAALLAYIFFPIHRRLRKKIRNEHMSAFILTLLVILVVAIPMGILLNSAAHEIVDIAKAKSFKVPYEGESAVCTAVSKINAYIASPEAKSLIGETLRKYSSSIISLTSSFLFSLPNLVAAFFIFLFVMFYTFKDGELFINYFKEKLPLSKSQFDRIGRKVREVTDAVVYGYIVVAFIISILGIGGFYIFGIPNPLFWGIVLFIVSLLPLIGPAFVWIPLSAYKLLLSLSLSQNTVVWQGIGLLFYGFVVLSGADNFLKAKIAGDKADVHPVVVLVGALGGLSLMGFIGILIGPLILALIIVCIDVVESG